MSDSVPVPLVLYLLYTLTLTGSTRGSHPSSPSQCDSLEPLNRTVSLSGSVPRTKYNPYFDSREILLTPPAPPFHVTPSTGPQVPTENMDLDSFLQDLRVLRFYVFTSPTLLVLSPLTQRPRLLFVPIDSFPHPFLKLKPV